MRKKKRCVFEQDINFRQCPNKVNFKVKDKEGEWLYVCKKHKERYKDDWVKVLKVRER